MIRLYFWTYFFAVLALAISFCIGATVISLYFEKKIKKLLNFLHFVANYVCISDAEWDNVHFEFQDKACNKLVELGIIKEYNGYYIYKMKDGK